ncbi:MAG: preprotein translocase subunit SecG [Planctomycetota bacterium]
MAYLFGLLIVLVPFLAALAKTARTRPQAQAPRARYGGVMTTVLIILAIILGLIALAASMRMRWLLGVLFLLVCLALIAAVLLQKDRGGGLGAAFGGAGNSAFGTKTGDAWTVVTIVLTALFLLIASVATYTFRPKDTKVPAPSFIIGSGDNTRVLTEGTVEVPDGFDVRILSPMPRTTIQYAWDGQELSDTQVMQGRSLNDLTFPDGQTTRTLRIQAHYRGFEPSDVRSITFKRAVPTAAEAAFSPVGGEIAEPVELTISSETENARIHYTLDGSTPDQNAQIYEGPITVQPGTTVKAIVYAEGHKPSAVTTAAFQAKQPAAGNGTETEDTNDTDQPEADDGNGQDDEQPDQPVEDDEQSLMPGLLRQAA